MTLYTGCIYDFATGRGIIGISVMSRHTLSDGKALDKEIVKGINYDVHYPLLGPPGELIGVYYKTKNLDSKEERWRRYVEGFNQHMEEPEVKFLLEMIAKSSLEKDIAFLCVERGGAIKGRELCCHRRLLAERCQILVPEVKIVHL